MADKLKEPAVLQVLAPTRRAAFTWCRENGHDPAGMRVITRPEQLWGLTGVQVVVVDRGACLGPAAKALNLATRMQQRGEITLRIVFTGTDALARAASMP